MKYSVLVGALLLGSLGESAIAHGLSLQSQVKSSIEVIATFEDGTPLKQAQIKVYKPNQPESVAFSGTTDDQGVFQFTPDISGNWDIFVRQAGHGSDLSLPVSLGDQGQIQLANNSNGQTLPQRIITIGAVIWGCIGTALYFKGRAK